MPEVYSQLLCLGIFIITGILIGLLFDVFRILRKSFHTVDWITYMQDILFWILAGSMMLFSIFTFNHGEIRSYVFIGMIIGIIIYILALSKIFVKSSVTIILFLKKVLSYPVHLIEKLIKTIVVKPILFIIKKGKGKIQLHNFTKSSKKLTEIDKN